MADQTIEQKALERRAEEALTKAYQEVDEWRRRAWVWEANSFSPAFAHLRIIAYKPETPDA